MSGITLTLTEEGHHSESLPVRATSYDVENFISLCLIECDIKLRKIQSDQIQCPLQIFDASCLQSGKFIAPAVSKVIVKQKRYVYKTIDGPSYEPRATQDILYEIHALARFYGQPNIAQIVGLVVSGNPYQTYPSNNMPRVWRALRQLHEEKRSHLDVKPSNIVLDPEGNAFLIDIGGGSYTLDWLSPGMRLFLEQNYEQTPANAYLCAQIGTDTWAYGKLLSVIAKKSGPSLAFEELRKAGSDLAKSDLESRIDLSAALEKLELYGKKRRYR
ncbi:hypothetical protein N7478_008080 [Penicillium angulare]|uniref:uncharacterized protein n=1 Tax=Penicillium angulare TaxID=116970 RepID=UPI00254258CA|nr:uncharacterized protein N7478_008080 [Penicillium angulare]KAJ5272955.1 hypothetical protein N7478_008080 [Penicillium angulare]